MLLNLSNHPSDRWTNAQRKAAIKAYGQLEDRPFPAIPPEYSSEQVKELCKEYLAKIKTIAPTAVHLMGEMTFTTTLVQLLQQAGIHVIASTTQRKVIEEEGGRKTVEFTFVQFREYPKV